MMNSQVPFCAFYEDGGGEYEEAANWALATPANPVYHTFEPKQAISPGKRSLTQSEISEVLHDLEYSESSQRLQ